MPTAQDSDHQGSPTIQETEVERPEHQDDPDVHRQPLPEPVPEEQDVHANHNGYQHEHVQRDGKPFSHPSLLLRVALLVNLADLQLVRPGRQVRLLRSWRPDRDSNAGPTDRKDVAAAARCVGEATDLVSAG